MVCDVDFDYIAKYETSNFDSHFILGDLFPGVDLDSIVGYNHRILKRRRKKRGVRNFNCTSKHLPMSIRKELNCDLNNNSNITQSNKKLIHPSPFEKKLDFFRYQKPDPKLYFLPENYKKRLRQRFEFELEMFGYKF